MKSLAIFLTLAALSAAGAFAQMSQPLVNENTTKISEHVWAIMGFPNIAIIMAAARHSVVDTGLGPKNGALPQPWPRNWRLQFEALPHHHALPS